MKTAGQDPKALKVAQDKLRAATKKMQDDVKTMDVALVSARRLLLEQDKKIAEMETALATGGGKDGSDKAVASIKEWKAARDRCAAELQSAEDAKRWADLANKQLEGTTIADEGMLVTASRKVNTAAEKILKAEDTISKGNELVKVVETLSSALK